MTSRNAGGSSYRSRDGQIAAVGTVTRSRPVTPMSHNASRYPDVVRLLVGGCYPLAARVGFVTYAKKVHHLEEILILFECVTKIKIKTCILYAYSFEAVTRWRLGLALLRTRRKSIIWKKFWFYLNVLLKLKLKRASCTRTALRLLPVGGSGWLCYVREESPSFGRNFDLIWMCYRPWHWACGSSGPGGQ